MHQNASVFSDGFVHCPNTRHKVSDGSDTGFTASRPSVRRVLWASVAENGRFPCSGQCPWVSFSELVHCPLLHRFIIMQNPSKAGFSACRFSTAALLRHHLGTCIWIGKGHPSVFGIASACFMLLWIRRCLGLQGQLPFPLSGSMPRVSSSPYQAFLSLMRRVKYCSILSCPLDFRLSLIAPFPL